MKLFKRNYIILIVLIALVSGVVTATAATKLFDSDEVAYDNSESGIQSDDVQGAIDELYAAATTYSELDQRLSKLETYSTTNYDDYLNQYGLRVIAVRNGDSVTLYLKTQLVSGVTPCSSACTHTTIPLLDMASGYFTVTTLDNAYKPAVGFVNYSVFSPGYYGQFNVDTSGNVKIGYVYHFSAPDTKINFPEKKGLYAVVTYTGKQL